MNIHLLTQAILQVLGLKYAKIKYVEKDIDNYAPKVEYSLPFDSEWYTINGGVTQNTSHSWGVLPQHFAYHFAIVDEEGGSCCGDKKDLHSYYCGEKV